MLTRAPEANFLAMRPNVLYYVLLNICAVLRSSFASSGNCFLKRFGPSAQLPLTTIVSFQDTCRVLDDVDSMGQFSSREEKIMHIKEKLEGLQLRSQKKAISILQNYGIPFQSFWISNKLSVESPYTRVFSLLSHLPEVLEIRAEKSAAATGLSIELLRSISTTKVDKQSSWGVEKIQAPDVWNKLNITGEGVTVGVIDSGVNAKHPELQSNWRKSYGWYDPLCKSSTPHDMSAKGHGTFVTGLIAGKNGIGVAPGIEWIACLGCRPEGCLESYTIACAQWMLCPTLTNGAKANCSKAPRIVNNSWGDAHNGTEDYFDLPLRAWRMAGIIPVFSIGNRGTKCQNTSYPGDSSMVIGVGSTDMNDTIASFSSRGPVDALFKPDFTAPGVQLVSANKSGGYFVREGTSFSAALVTGTAALMLSRNPNLDYHKLWQHLVDSCDRPERNLKSCGNVPTTKFPNHVYGYGRINAYNAVEAVKP